MACNYGLLWIIHGLLWGVVAFYFRLLGVPGNHQFHGGPSQTKALGTPGVGLTGRVSECSIEAVSPI